MLTEEEVIARGIECFKEGLRDNTKYGKQYTTPWLPSSYKCGGVRFTISVYLNLTEDSSAGSLQFGLFNDLDPFSTECLDAVQVAIWLHNQISDINLIMMFIGEDHIDTVLSDDTPEGLLRTRQQLNLLKDMEIFPYLPPERKQEITNAIALCGRLYTEMLQQQQEAQIKEMRSSPKHGFVYLIQSPTGSYKIGRTKDPTDRMRTFSVKLPFEVDYVCTIETADMYALERELHQRYASKRINGEWFMLDSGDVAAIQGVAVQA